MDILKNKKEKLIIIILEHIFQLLIFITYLNIYFIKRISDDTQIILEGILNEKNYSDYIVNIYNDFNFM